MAKTAQPPKGKKKQAQKKPPKSQKADQSINNELVSRALKILEAQNDAPQPGNLAPRKIAYYLDAERGATLTGPWRARMERELNIRLVFRRLRYAPRDRLPPLADISCVIADYAGINSDPQGYNDDVQVATEAWWHHLMNRSAGMLGTTNAIKASCPNAKLAIVIDREEEHHKRVALYSTLSPDTISVWYNASEADRNDGNANEFRAKRIIRTALRHADAFGNRGVFDD